MKALILAAGYATRLYPLTKEYPKPLLKVGERSIIDYIIDKLVDLEDIDEIIVVTNSKFISRFQKWKNTHRFKKPLVLVDDLTKTQREKRGAIGDMHFVIGNRGLEDDLLVIGGDNLFDGDLKDFISFAKAHKARPVLGVYNISDIHEAKKYGVIKLNQRNRIIEFQEKPKAPLSTLVAMCLYYFPKEKLARVREYIGSNSNQHDATGFYIDWLRKREPVFGFIFSGRWYDIGHHNFYREAKTSFRKRGVVSPKFTSYSL